MGDLGERVVAGGIERIAVIPQLDEHPVAPERLDHPPQLASRRVRSVGDQRRRYRPLAAAGEHPGVAGERGGEVVEDELRRALLAGEVTDAERP